MNVKGMYNELLATSIILNVLDSLLTAFVVFSMGLFVIHFYRISIYFAVGISALFFIRSLIRKIRENKIMILENKYPNLKERLRTSFDYKDKTNQIIDELHSDIFNMLQKVDVNAFLKDKEIIFKTGVICLFLFGTLYYSSIGFDILDIRDAVVKSSIYQRTTDFTKDLFETRDEVKDRPLLDNPRLIQLGKNEMNISIETYNTELDINKIEDSEKNDYGGHFPEEVQGAAQEIYDEQIPEEHKDVIKEYFKKINE